MQFAAIKGNKGTSASLIIMAVLAVLLIVSFVPLIKNSISNATNLTYPERINSSVAVDQRSLTYSEIAILGIFVLLAIIIALVAILKKSGLLFS